MGLHWVRCNRGKCVLTFHMRSTSWPELGSRVRSGLAHRICSTSPRGCCQQIHLGRHHQRLREVVRLRHDRLVRLVPRLGSGSCAQDGPRDHTSSIGRLLEHHRSDGGLDNLPAHVLVPDSDSTASSPWSLAAGSCYFHVQIACSCSRAFHSKSRLRHSARHFRTCSMRDVRVKTLLEK